MGTRLFVGNVNPEATEEALLRFFSQAGTVVDLRMPLDRESRKPRGFAFVEYGSEEEAERALTSLDEASFEGRRLRLRWAVEEGRHKPRGRPRHRRLEAEMEPEEERGRRRWEEDDDSGRRDGDSEPGRRHPRGRKRRRHGSDRMRGRGTRRQID